MTDTTPRSVAALNATTEQKTLRSVGRVKTLRRAIDKATARGQAERLASLQAEHDRRMAELAEFRAQLDALDVD